jgi:hypothetical protein
MKKVIIGIHGLGNKPPKAILKNWWKASIEEGLEFIDQPHPFFKFEMVFWADLLYPHLEDPKEKDPDNPFFIKEPYYYTNKQSTYIPNYTKTGHHKFISDQLDKLFLNTTGKLNFSSLSDYIIRHNFRDLDLYFSTKKLDNSNITIREAIQKRFIRIIKKYKNREILLIAHSMGSIITLDILSHFKEIKIDTLITIGSPLGLAAIRSKINPTNEKHTVSSIPQTIKNKWYNLADLNDKVALDFDLNDDFKDNSQRIIINDIQIYNDYSYNGERNPHKAFGYLRNHEMAKIIHDFLMKDTLEYFHNFVFNFNKIIYRITKRKIHL